MKRITIALMVDSFLGEYQSLIREAVEATARVADFDLYCIVGRDLDSPHRNHLVQNSIFSQVDTARIDGIMVLGSSLSNYCGPQRIAEFCGQYGDLPLVCIGVAVPGIPSILLDNTQFALGVRHLVQNHGCRKLAYLGGLEANREAEIRRAAFLEVLHDNGLELDAALEVKGKFIYQTGLEATVELLERRRPFDALVVANDEMALGALKALEQFNIKVPEEVRLIAFDDMPEGRFSRPSLTTMRQPIDRMGRLAVDLLARMLAGDEDVPMVTEVAPTLVVRQRVVVLN